MASIFEEIEICLYTEFLKKNIYILLGTLKIEKWRQPATKFALEGRLV